MKPVYDMCTHKWRVKGLGVFDTIQEAKNAMQNCKKKTMLNVRVSEETLNKLQELAISQNTTVSDVVRQIIEKEGAK